MLLSNHKFCDFHCKAAVIFFSLFGCKKFTASLITDLSYTQKAIITADHTTPLI